jgi:lysine 2,3-aminomutase
MLDTSRFNPEYLRSKAPEIFAIAGKAKSLDDLRTSLAQLAHNMMFEAFDDYDALTVSSMIRVRDCAKVMVRMMTRRSEDKAKFSVAQAIMDIAHAKDRPDLAPAFFAEMLYLFRGLQGRGPGLSLADLHIIPVGSQGRQAAMERSIQLDELSAAVKLRTEKYVSGLESESIKKGKASQKDPGRTRWFRRKLVRLALANRSHHARYRAHFSNAYAFRGRARGYLNYSKKSQTFRHHALLFVVDG